MKLILRILGVIVLVIAVALIFIAVRGIPSYEVNAPDYTHTSSPEAIAKGKKHAMMLCAGCHMNQETGKLTGKLMTDAPPEFGTIYAPNITQDETYGIAAYTDAELVYLLRTGIKRDGKYAPPYMAKLPNLADEDLNAIIAFLRSDDRMVEAEAVPDKPCEPSFLTKFLSTVAFKPLPMPENAIPLPDTSNPVEFGKYLVHNFDCFTCHSADFKSIDMLNPTQSEGYMGGGNKPLDLEGNVILTANLTPDKETGIGNWTKEQFVQALKYGTKEGEAALRYPMVPYTQLTDYEAGCIFDYLQTVPAISNKIDRGI